ncbi:hypothetical protein ERD95_06075 [Enterobacteriaceae bacterium ML5]|nr:hypothetical protein ERD95_06075 [Enterobacteriaceae bacterium ML5]
MIKRILLWLINIYFKPVTTETKTPEVETMSDLSVGDSQPAVEVVTKVTTDSDPTAVQAVAEAKAGVADLDAALNFIESGVAQLGEAAKDELKELAKKYL